MKALLNKKLYNFKNNELITVCEIAISKGYRLYTFVPSSNVISQIFISNSVTFGSVSASYSGVTYSTCHKSITRGGNGSGFRMSDECQVANESDLETIFNFAPRWAANLHTIKKQTWEEYLEKETILTYGELKLYKKQ